MFALEELAVTVAGTFGASGAMTGGFFMSAVNDAWLCVGMDAGSWQPQGTTGTCTVHPHWTGAGGSWQGPWQGTC